MKISKFIQHPRTEKIVVGVIVANALILTAETMVHGPLLAILKVLDTACLVFFVLEILLRLGAAAEPDRGQPWARRPWLAVKRFSQNGWNIFDVCATLAAFVPGLNALRTLRLLRLIAQVPMFRATVEDLLHACQRTLPLIMLAALLLFVGALTGVLAFGQVMPDLFGNLAIKYLMIEPAVIVVIGADCYQGFN